MNFELIFKATPYPCLILAADPPAYTIMRVNEAYKRMTHTKDQELRCKSFLQAFPFIFPDTDLQAVGQVAGSLNQIMAAHKPLQPKFHARQAFQQGRGPTTSRHLELNHAPVLNELGEIDFIIQTLTDITHQRKLAMEHRLLKEDVLQKQEQYRCLFENNPDGLYSLDLVGNMVNANPRLLQLLGCRLEDLNQENFPLFFVPEDQQKLAAMIDQAKLGHTNQLQTRISVGKGQQRTVHIAHFPIITQNRIRGIYGLVQDITPLVQTAQELEDRERQLSTIYNTVGEVIFVLDIVSPGRYLFSSVNNAFLEATGLPLEKVVGHDVAEVIPEPALSFVLGKYEQAIREKRKVYWEETHPYPSGLLTGEIHVSPVFDEQGQALQLIGAVHDLTRWKQAEAALATSEQIYKSLFEFNPDAVFSLDLEGNFMSANERVATLTQVPVSQLLHTSYKKLIPPQDLERVNTHFRRAVAGENQHYETSIRTAKNDYILINVTKLPIRVNGEIIGVYGIAKDITAARESEVWQQKLTEDLFRQNQDLQQFTYIVSHNLRAPVANTLGLVELLINREEKDELTPQALTHMQVSLQQLDLVLNELNMILSLRENKPLVHLGQVDLLLLCEQVVQKLSHRLDESAGSIVWQIPPGTTVWANKAFLYSVLYNLLSNAIKFRSPDRRLRITLASPGNTPQGVTFTVSDNGIGMDLKRVSKKIFNLYNRFHAGYEGRGIGLFLVKSHVEAMGGHIEVSSQKDVGTTFKTHLPAPDSQPQFFSKAPPFLPTP